MAAGAVDVYWIPLGAGAGGTLVRFSGRVYEAGAAAISRRPRRTLYHSALEITVDDVMATIEMAPVWTKSGDRGVVAEGPRGRPDARSITAVSLRGPVLA